MSVVPHPSKGPGWWQIIYYPTGRKKQERIAVEGTREEAEAHEQDLRLECRNDIGNLSHPRLNQVVPEFMMHYSLDHLPAGVYNMRRYMRYMIEFFGNHLFPAITPREIERYKHHRLAQGIARTTINKEISGLNKLLEYAESCGYCRAFKSKRFPNKLTKAPLPDVPTRAECLAFIDSCIWPACGLFACLYYAGLRRNEAATMTVERMHMDRGMFIVLGKGHKERGVPIAADLFPYLRRRLSEIDTGLLWTSKSGSPLTDLRPHIKWAKKRAGITRRFYPHLLRHAFGTHSTMDGIGIRSLQRMMGHTVSTTTEIYTTLADEFLVEDIKKFGGRR